MDAPRGHAINVDPQLSPEATAAAAGIVILVIGPLGADLLSRWRPEAGSGRSSSSGVTAACACRCCRGQHHWPA